MPSFDDLLAEGSAVPVAGWDFSWFDGRASEERPPWGYARTLGARMAALTGAPGAAALDLQTGGGEVLATIPAAGLQEFRGRMEFYDVAAVVHFLRKVIWIVPGFTPGAYRERLRVLHERMEAEGPFVATSVRFLIEARKPA